MSRFGTVPGRFEVIGRSITSILEATGTYAGVTRKIFMRYGMKTIHNDSWYPLQPFLDAFRDVAKEVGDATLLVVGKKIPEFARWPAGVTDVVSAIESVDDAYHMNHRKDGVPMFDPATGVKIEGIGHYRCERVGKNKIIAVADSPYPSAFDKGIFLGTGRRFEPAIEVELDTDKPSRLRGGESCTYILTW